MKLMDILVTPDQDKLLKIWNETVAPEGNPLSVEEEGDLCYAASATNAALHKMLAHCQSTHPNYKHYITDEQEKITYSDSRQKNK